MRVLCVLQNAWGDRELPLRFEPNPFNKSAKVIKKICGDIPFHFSNTTATTTASAAEKAPIDPEHFKKVQGLFKEYDIVLICGEQAKKALLKYGFPEDKVQNYKVFFIPHPASRRLSNKQIQEMSERILK